MFATIAPGELHDIVQQNGDVDLVYVRAQVEFRQVHIAFARNVPLDRLDPKGILGQREVSRPLYVICRSRSRGKQACEQLLADGGTSVVNVEGGTLAWEEAGLPVVHGKRAMSLERQVRIATGSLTAIGSALGYFGQCSSGTCPLTSTWWRGAIYGSVMGLLMALGSGR